MSDELRKAFEAHCQRNGGMGWRYDALPNGKYHDAMLEYYWQIFRAGYALAQARATPTSDKQP